MTIGSAALAADSPSRDSVATSVVTQDLNIESSQKRLRDDGAS